MSKSISVLDVAEVYNNEGLSWILLEFNPGNIDVESENGPRLIALLEESRRLSREIQELLIDTLIHNTPSTNSIGE
jgi:hypothetical protein